jgi:phosphoglycolate phosphatase
MKKFHPKLILIDVDGTLVDSVPDLAYCVDEMMIQLGMPTRGESRVRHWVGNGVPRLVERALTGDLDYLQSKNYLLGCVTNKAEQFTHPLLKSLNIFDYFKIVISGDTLEKKKPDPLPLLHGARFFNIDPKECLMLGDSVSDVKAARAAGFDIICMSYGYNHGNNILEENPDLVIDSMTQLRECL